MRLEWPSDYVNKIICRDCLEVMKGMPDECVDLIVTDPPYNTNLDYGRPVDDNRTIPAYKSWCQEWFQECLRLSGRIVITPGRANLGMWLTNIREPDWMLIWYLPNGMTRTSVRGFLTWEPILTYGKPIKRIINEVLTVGISAQRGLGKHPCPKPLNLFVKLIDFYSREGEIVLDPFFGSGTTLEASKNLKRNFIGIEINPEYCKIAEERLSQGVL